MGCCCILSLNTKSKPSNLNLTSPCCSHAALEGCGQGRQDREAERNGRQGGAVCVAWAGWWHAGGALNCHMKIHVCVCVFVCVCVCVCVCVHIHMYTHIHVYV
jgi:hypothetical protein